MLRSLHFALRQLRKSPGYALAVIVTLALGIGVNTAVFSMVDGFMLRRLPYAEPERIAALMTHIEGSGKGGHWTAEDDSHVTDDWRAVRQNAPALTVAASQGEMDNNQTGVNLKLGADAGGAARFVHAANVSTHYFEVLGIHPYLGREFTEDESRQGGPKAVILGYDLWRFTFHGDRGIIGKPVDVKGEPYTVVGVLPPNAKTPNASASLWTSLQPGVNGACQGYDCILLARLKPGATWEQAQAQLERIEVHPDNYGGVKKAWLYARPLQQYSGSDAKPKVLVLMIVVASILLIACANLAGLALVRISRRTQEIATRLALGASRMDVLRQFWMENLVLAVLGAGVGLALAEIILSGLKSFLPAGLVPQQGLALDTRVLVFTFGSALLTSLLFGALPALVSRRVDLRSSIAISSYAVAGGSSRLRKTLIGAEVAMTVVLVAGAGLLVRTLAHLETLPPGFDPRNVMTAKASLDDARYHDAAAFQSLLTRSLDSMKRIPGVENAAMGLSLPYERGLNLGIQIMDGKFAGQTYGSSTAYVTPGYFSTLRMPLLAGRDFRENDSAQSEQVTVVNLSFAKQYFGETNVLGRHIQLQMGHGTALTMTIVGIVSDVTKAPGINPTGPLSTEPVYYVPAAQFPADGLAIAHLWFQPSWVVRTHGPVSGITEKMEHAMAEADPNLPFSGFFSMDDLMKQELQMQRVEVMLLSMLAGLALLLSAVGIYALVSNLVVQRTREIGIRMALGSTIHQAMVEIGSSGMLAAAGGLAVGVGLSFFALRVLRSEIYGVGVYDPVTLLGAPVLLAIIAFIATLFPSMRITRIDPAKTLRAE